MSHVISTLPCEIVQNILEYLPLKDRKSASLVCRLWNQEAFSSRLLASTELKIVNVNTSSRLLEALQNSNRLYRNICVDTEEYIKKFESINAALDVLGCKIQNLTIASCLFPDDVEDCCSWLQLKELIIRMPNLRHLSVSVWDENVFPMEPQRNGICSTKQRMAFPALTELLSLDIRVYVADIPEFQYEKLEILKIGGFYCGRMILPKFFYRGLPLKELHLDGELSRDLLELICKNCPLLAVLAIRTSDLESTSFQCLEKLKNLQVLAVDSLRLDWIRHCKPIKSVVKLYLTTNPRDCEEALADQLHKVFPNLQKVAICNIQFRFCLFLVRPICRKFIRLKKLALLGFPGYRFIEHEFPYDLGNVESLSLRELCLNFNCSPLKNVKRLKMDGISLGQAASDDTRIVECFPNLQSLEVRSCGQLEQYIEDIPRKIPSCVVNYEVKRKASSDRDSSFRMRCDFLKKNYVELRRF